MLEQKLKGSVGVCRAQQPVPVTREHGFEHVQVARVVVYQKYCDWLWRVQFRR